MRFSVLFLYCFLTSNLIAGSNEAEFELTKYLKPYSSASQLSFSAQITTILYNNESYKTDYKVALFNQQCRAIMGQNEVFFNQEYFLQIDHASKIISAETIDPFYSDSYDFFNYNFDEEFDKVLKENRNGIISYTIKYNEPDLFNSIKFSFSEEKELSKIVFDFAENHPLFKQGVINYAIEFQSILFKFSKKSANISNYLKLDQGNFVLANQYQDYLLKSSISTK